MNTVQLTVFEEPAFVTHVQLILRSPLVSGILFAAYALLVYRLTRGRWRSASRAVKVFLALLPLLLILVFPPLVTGEPLAAKYGLWVDTGRGVLVFRTLGKTVEWPLCNTSIRLETLDSVMDRIGLRLLGISDPTSGYYVGVFTVEGGGRAYMLVHGSAVVVVAEYCGSIIVFGAASVEDTRRVYDELLDVWGRVCGG